MGIDKWMSLYLKKLSIKYISEADNIEFFKKINFLKSYIRFMIELPMAYDVSVNFQDLEFISSYLRHLHEESMAMENPSANYDKVREFISLVEIYISFMEKFPTFEESTYRELFSEFISGIHETYFKHASLKILNAEE